VLASRQALAQAFSQEVFFSAYGSTFLRAVARRQLSPGYETISMTVQQIIETKLKEALTPDALEVSNVSHRHSHHQSSPLTGESHFEVAISSARFEGMSRVQRHKLVYQILAEEMAGPVHALQVTTKAPHDP
jgi:BolA protein